MLNFNKRFEKTFGYSKEEIPTLEVWWLLAYPDPDYREWVIDACYSGIEQATETNTDIEPIEYKVTCKNGDILTMRVFGSFVGEDLLLTFFDVTERQKAEMRLADSEKLHRTTIENISDTVLITDDEGVFTYICPNTRLIFGRTAEEVEALGNISLLFSTTLFDYGELNRKKEIRNIETTIIDHHGQEHFLLVNIKQVSINTGTILYTCREVIDHKQAENEIFKQKRLFETMFNAIPDGVVITYDRK